jgi:two-component system, OmpR family, response regulator ChvI
LNSTPDEEIKFSDRSENYCVCIIDMVNSTSITAKMTNSDDVKKYYGIFINTMATIARNFEGKVIKNTGDSVIYYFPNTCDSSNECAFRNVLECCLTMIAANSVIGDKLYEEILPVMKYRISADYGKVHVAKSYTSDADDLFGTTVNLCAKINRYAEPNTMIIGGDLYLVLKSIPVLKNDYYLKQVGFYSLGIRASYPLYSVTSKYEKPAIGDFMQIPELRPVGSSRDAAFMSSSPSSAISGAKFKALDPGLRGQRVMIVDDDPDILSTFEALLVSQNIIVDKFKDAMEALKHFAQANLNYYQLIILDIRMPGLNGLQLYYRLKAINKSIKVLFVSALDSSEELVSILPGIQIEQILKKPVDRDFFISAIIKNLADVTDGASRQVKDQS